MGSRAHFEKICSQAKDLIPLPQEYPLLAALVRGRGVVQHLKNFDKWIIQTLTATL